MDGFQTKHRHGLPLFPVPEAQQQIGGGVEVPLNDRLALRVGADYRRVFTADGLHDPRFSTGAAYRFGGR